MGRPADAQPGPNRLPSKLWHPQRPGTGYKHLRAKVSKKAPTHVAYLDLEAAFCAVPHWAIKKTLERLNIPQWAVDLMQHIDIGAFTSVIMA